MSLQTLLQMMGAPQPGMDIPGAIRQQGQNQQQSLDRLMQNFGHQGRPMLRRDIRGGTSGSPTPGLDAWHQMNPDARTGEFDPNGHKVARRRDLAGATQDLAGQNAFVGEQVWGDFLDRLRGNQMRPGGAQGDQASSPSPSGAGTQLKPEFMQDLVRLVEQSKAPAQQDLSGWTAGPAAQQSSGGESKSYPALDSATGFAPGAFDVPQAPAQDMSLPTREQAGRNTPPMPEGNDPMMGFLSSLFTPQAQQAPEVFGQPLPPGNEVMNMVGFGQPLPPGNEVEAPFPTSLPPGNESSPNNNPLAGMFTQAGPMQGPNYSAGNVVEGANSAVQGGNAMTEMLLTYLFGGLGNHTAKMTTGRAAGASQFLTELLR